MKTFPLKVEQELHIQIKIEATKKGQTLGEWIHQAIAEKLANG